MSLSRAFIEKHIAEWEQRLSQKAFSYRSSWPSRLFHHAPVQNAVQILKSGRLLSRNDSASSRAVDVAGRDVINLRTEAHDFVRMYFRPRTPTQFHIEGIRKPAEYYHGERDTHAPVLIMLIFDAKSILTKRGVFFSNGNMQSPWSEHGDTEEFFSAIEFHKVYHDSWIEGDRTIISARCAEVLPPSPLDITDSIQWICCRSHAERQMLLYLLGEDAKAYSDKVIVSDDLRVFDKRFTYVEEVGIQSDGVTFRLSPRNDNSDLLVKVVIADNNGRQYILFGPGHLSAKPPNAKLWRADGNLKPGNYLVRIEVEECCAYEASLRLSEDPF